MFMKTKQGGGYGPKGQETNSAVFWLYYLAQFLMFLTSLSSSVLGGLTDTNNGTLPIGLLED